MNKKNITRLTLALVLAIALVAVCLFSLNQQAQVAEANSGKVDGYASYSFLALNNVIASSNGTGKVVVDYGWLDCYEIIDITGAQAVTVTMQHSPDNTNWVNCTDAFPVLAVADATLYLGVPVSGTYMRANVELNSANNVTVTVKCTAKDLTR